MPGVTMKSFRRRKKGGKKKANAANAQQLDVLKAELLMLHALKNKDEEETKLVELCKTISIDDLDAVKGFVAEAREESLLGIDVLLAWASQDDGFEILSVNSDSTGTGEDCSDAGGADAMARCPYIDIDRVDEDEDDRSVFSAGAGAATSVVSPAASLATSRAKLAAERARNKAVVAEKALEYKVAATKRRQEEVREEFTAKMLELKRYNEESSRRKREEAQRNKEEAQKKQGELALMQKAEAHKMQVEMALMKKAEEKMKREEEQIKREVARMKKEEKEMQKVVKKLQKKEKKEVKKQQKNEEMERKREEYMRALKATKQKELDEVQAAAINDLELALGKVERAQEVADKVEKDPEYEIDDELSLKSSTWMSVSGRSKKSVFSKSSSGKGLFFNKISKRESEVIGLYVGDDETEIRDDITAISSRSQGALLSHELSTLRAKLNKLQLQIKGEEGRDDDDGPDDAMLRKTVSFSDEVRDSRNKGAATAEEPRDGAPVDEEPELDVVQWWLEWLMGMPEDAPCCGSSQGSGGSDCGLKEESSPKAKSNKRLAFKRKQVIVL